MRLALLAAFLAALAIFGCSDLSDDPVETPATPSVEAPVTTPSVDVPVTVPVTAPSPEHHKRRKHHHHHHHKHRHPAEQPEPAAGSANNPEVPQAQTPFDWNGWQSN